MNLMKHSMAVRAEKRDRSDPERPRQWRQEIREVSLDPLCLSSLKPARQSKVEPEFLCYIWIAPLGKQRILAQGQTLAASIDLNRIRGASESIQFGNAFEGKAVQQGGVACRHKRNETADMRQRQSIKNDWRALGGDQCNAGFKLFQPSPAGYAKRRFKRAVEAIPARSGGYFRDTGN